MRDLLAKQKPDIVALQEADWQGIDESSDLLEEYPYHIYRPDQGAPSGEAILSKYPILQYDTYSGGANGTWDFQRVLWAQLDLGHGKTMVVVDAHPINAINSVYGCFYCPQMRDRQITEINHFTMGLVKQGENVLLVGDMNVTDREKAYSSLVQGLRDIQVLVGGGSGNSWGLPQTNRFWAFERIDYVLSGPTVQPLYLTTDCQAVGSDHCALIGVFAL
ncbi:hypothetical protein KSB_84290 [Ktedonobacter robiniae]|uniref:Endonuclease/exonuclease/phosphatase domain-containing protein n=1 Tax=Ktedonobacter robiniae TaxID=2778365 RepID=A0ABQ3V459_9CHLR|nr:hypothetical protein KSB_84290 [Ktedonobacter robiniae]